jgi:3-hydroxyisobutyrate dehydrogenase-like beta-hydroxyacid dehydrogenase
MSISTIGMVGLGLMGHGIAKNLLAKGFGVRFVVHRDRSRLADLVAAGAQERDSVATLAQGTPAVLLCVTGTPQVESIIYGHSGQGGLLGAMAEGSLVIDASTAEPASTARIRADFERRGVAYIDAPLARTPKEAEEGRLNTMVGASDADFERARPIFAAYCENVIHVGPPGHGHTLKLINNMLSMTTACAVAEAAAAAAKAGLALPKVFQLLSAGAVNSGVLQLTLGRAVEGDLAGLKFTLANAQKDLRYYTHVTEMLATTSPLAEATHQTLVQANNLGLGDRYVASLFEAQEQLNGVRIVPR